MWLRTLKWEAFRIILESGNKNNVLPCLTDSKAQNWCVERQVDRQDHVKFLTVMEEGQRRSPIEFSAKVWKEKPSGQPWGGEITKKQWVGLGENMDTDGQASYPEANWRLIRLLESRVASSSKSDSQYPACQRVQTKHLVNLVLFTAS